MSILDHVEKPARYTGGELNSVYKQNAEVDFAMCFADTYEVGMSHLGINILYEVINAIDGVYAQRVFCPWVDMIEQLRSGEEPLRSLETKKPLCEFDIVGINLSYEMCYSNVLTMLELGRIPLLSKDRGDGDPLVLGGGACTINPEPVADFFDLFAVGEGEEVTRELIALYRRHKKAGFSRQAFLREAAQIDGIYVPSLYGITYHEDGTIRSITPKEGAPQTVTRRIVKDFDAEQTIRKPVLPYINTVHDRCTLEIMRGCPRGCRFCQAGFAMRPVRERKAQTVRDTARSVIESTGYDEISLSSLSSGDYSQIDELVGGLVDEFSAQRVSVSLPSLRVDSFEKDLAAGLQQVRKTGLTFAPEAGTQRLRNVINKNVTEDDLFGAIDAAFKAGWRRCKLYFMIGLPTETDEDIKGIASLVQRAYDRAKAAVPPEHRGNVRVSASVALFVPKSQTPFQWDGQIPPEEALRRVNLLRNSVKYKAVDIHWHDPATSFVEAVMSRGGRQAADWVEAAWRRGARFDAWTELFLEEAWRKAASDVGIDPAEIAQAQWDTSRVMPWAHISTGVTTRYLALERKRAAAETTTPDCTFEKCTGCGACQALDCDNMLAGIRSTPSAPAVAAGEAAADVTPAQAALAAEVSAEAAAQAEVGDAPASEITPAGAEAVGAPASAAVSPAATGVLGNDSSAEAASDERPLPMSEGGAR